MSTRGAWRRWLEKRLEALAFSSTWVAAAAALLTAASARAMGIAVRPAAVVLAFAGTLVVYNVDRLRDVARDRETSPARTAFIISYRPGLVVLTAGAAVLAMLAGLRAGPEVAVLAGGILALGLFHRRMKHLPLAKALYLAGAWTAIVVGVPALLDPAAAGVSLVAAVLYVTLLANAVASNVRDAEAGAARFGLKRSLRFARILAAAGLALSLTRASTLDLAWIPGATFVALAAFRPSERYGLLVVDGALVVGAALAIAT